VDKSFFIKTTNKLKTKSMKTKFFFFTIFLTSFFCVHGQINLEASYNSASSDLYMVNLEVDGEKYVKVQRGDSAFRFITLYNLDHSLWKTIDCNPFPIFTFIQGIGALNNGRFDYDILYITQHLFDNDDDIEFLYTVRSGNCPQFYTGIYNEDGSSLFTQDSAAPLVRVNVPIAARPIYNTVNGTKMILSFPCSNEAKVYSLSGTLTNSLGLELVDDYKLLAYPNPSSEYTTIEYEFPQGINQGEIAIYDLNGREIKRYSIDNTFKNLILYNNDLSSGTYMYSLEAKGKVIEAKKMLIVK